VSLPNRRLLVVLLVTAALVAVLASPRAPTSPALAGRVAALAPDPTINLTSPLVGLTRDPSVLVGGTVDPTNASVTVNGVSAAVAGDGSFGVAVGLAEGLNWITVVATDWTNATDTVYRTIVRDSTPPALTVSSPGPGGLSNASVVRVAGVAEPFADLAVNGVRVAVNATGSWSVDLAFEDGPRTILTTASDLAGNVASDVRGILVDATPPTITLTAPTAVLTGNASVVVAGLVSEPVALLTVNGAPASVAADRSFSIILNLTEGQNVITIVAVDFAAHAGMATPIVVVDTTAPALSVTTPVNLAVFGRAVVRVAGTTEAGAILTVNGVLVAVRPTGAWSVDLALPDGSQGIVTVASDYAGNSAMDVRGVYVDTVAPVLTLTSPVVPITNDPDVVVSGFVDDPSALVFVNGAPVAVSPGTGTFTTTLALADGEHAILVVAADAAHQTTALTGILVDTVAPDVKVSRPLNGTETERASVLVEGTVDDLGATILVNGILVRPDPTYRWSVIVAVREGENTLRISAVDLAGNEAPVLTRTVTFTSPIPALEEDVISHNQRLFGLEGNLALALILVLAVLAAVQGGLYWSLRRRIAASRGPRSWEAGKKGKGG